MDVSQHIEKLLQKAIRHEASADELTELMQWLQDDPAQERTLWMRQLLDLPLDAAYDPAERRYWDAMAASVLSADRTVHVRRISPLRRWGWAAAAAILLGIITIWTQRTSQESAEIAAESIQDIAPGGNKAILTLADGSVVKLDSAGHRTIRPGIMQQGAELVYAKQGKDTVSYNTLITPRGGLFRVKLPDNTVVWLNAASALKYPTAFIGRRRIVELNGEAYFEVAKDAKMPFCVKVNGLAEVEVLGTSFNISAYDNDKNINTTLLNGAVRVNGAILKPGQQARINRQQKNTSILQNADTEKVMAWKNGIFNFENATLQEAMQELERWYDIEVVYEKDIPDIPFSGKITRNVSLAGLLKMLAGAGLKFDMQANRKLVITK